MHLAALTHLTIAAQTISACDRVIVLGSSALLASLPALAGADGPLELTRDADLLLLPSDAALAALVHEALGEGSLFDARFGYHVDVLRPEICQSLAAGWEARLVPVAGSAALALSPEDVAAVKCTVGRPKDEALVRTLFALGAIGPADVRALLGEIHLSERDARLAFARLSRWQTP